MRCFTACRANRISAGCTSSHTGCRLSHRAENIHETYYGIQILTIPTADFIGRTATTSSSSSGMPHDLNVYPGCAGRRFTVCCFGKPKSFETSPNGATLPHGKIVAWSGTYISLIFSFKFLIFFVFLKFVFIFISNLVCNFSVFPSIF